MQVSYINSALVTSLIVFNTDSVNCTFVNGINGSSRYELANSKLSNRYHDLRETVVTLTAVKKGFDLPDTPERFKGYGDSGDDELCHFDQKCFDSDDFCRELPTDSANYGHISVNQEKRLAYLLCEHMTSHAEDQSLLSGDVMECLKHSDSALVNGDIKVAFEHLSELRKLLPEKTCSDLELGLTTMLGITPMSFFRNPRATLPNGARIEPDSHSGGYHGTTLIKPNDALSKGLPVRGSNLSLLDHVLDRGNSAFRGATPTVSDPDGLSGAALWATEDGWVYDIRHVPTWCIEHDLEGRREKQIGYSGDPLIGELEVAIPGYIPPENIKRFGKVEERHGRLCVVKWESNSSYRYDD